MLGLSMGGSVSRVLFRIKQKLSQGRVDFVGIGDSNQLLSGHGWDHGFQYALDSLGYSMWATGLVSQNENNSNGAGQGYSYNRVGALIGAISGADANLDKYLNKGLGGLAPADYTYVADGNSTTNTISSGLILAGDCPIGVENALDFDVHYGTFNSGAGSFKPSVRLEQSPYTLLLAGSVVNTNTGSFGMSKSSIQISADPTRAGKNISGKPIQVGNTGITGPYFSTYYRFRNTGVTTGYSYGTLNYRGGESLRTMAEDMQEASNETLEHYFGILRNDQNQDEKCIAICVNSGLNDRNETDASLGSAGVTDGDGASALVDNFRAIQDRIEGIWIKNGWDINELLWLFFPSHPIDDPNDTELESYSAAIKSYARGFSRMQVVDLNLLTDEAEMLAQGWYASGGSDRNHLTQSGYEQLAVRLFQNVK